MSIKLMTKAWNMPIPQGQKMLLLALCDHANDDGDCYPSQDSLSRRCSMSLRAVVMHLKWLEEHGILRRERRQKTNVRQSNLYHIFLDGFTGENGGGNGGESAKSACAKSACAKSACAKSAPPNVQILQCASADFAHSLYEEPSMNRQLEPSRGCGAVETAPPSGRTSEVFDDVFGQPEICTDLPPSEQPDPFGQHDPFAQPVAVGQSADPFAKPAAPIWQLEPSVLPAARKPNPHRPPSGNPANAATWDAYAAAYRRRYGILPERNAKVAGQVAQFVKYVGGGKAPVLAEYFVSHNGAWFVQTRHEFGQLLRAYQQIATDYQIGQQSTRQAAAEAEKTQNHFDVAAAVLAERKRRRENGV